MNQIRSDFGMGGMEGLLHGAAAGAAGQNVRVRVTERLSKVPPRCLERLMYELRPVEEPVGL